MKKSRREEERERQHRVTRHADPRLQAGNGVGGRSREQGGKEKKRQRKRGSAVCVPGLVRERETAKPRGVCFIINDVGAAASV